MAWNQPAAPTGQSISIGGLIADAAAAPDAASFIYHRVGHSYIVDDEGRVPTVTHGAMNGHKGGRVPGGPAEESKGATIGSVTIETRAEMRSMPVQREKSKRLPIDGSPDYRHLIAMGVQGRHIVRELEVFFERDFINFLTTVASWNASLSAAVVGAGNFFGAANAPVYEQVLEILRGTNADTLIMDELTRRAMVDSASLISKLGTTGSQVVSDDILLAIFKKAHPLLQQVVVTSAVNDPIDATDFVVGDNTTNFVWAGRTIIGPDQPTMATALPGQQLPAADVAFINGLEGNPIELSDKRGAFTPVPSDRLRQFYMNVQLQHPNVVTDTITVAGGIGRLVLHGGSRGAVLTNTLGAD